MKMPNWAAAPKKIMNGFLSSGVKSIIAPTAIKIRIGKSSVAMPASNSTRRKPGSCSRPSTADTPSIVGGRLARMAPKPIGSSRAGS